ncbi:MAG: hypothetical protein ACYCZO_17330 [Daejeonella sp.]
MEITILNWRLEPKTSDDVRTVNFLLRTSLADVPEKLATINLSGSLMTQVDDYIDAQSDSEDFILQLGRLAAALLRKELEMNPKDIYNPNLKFGYMTESFPYGAVEIPDIDTPQDWKFVI